MSDPDRGGRPSKYDPEYHPGAVIELGKLGKSHAQIASALDVARDTLYEWAREHVIFSDAIKRARSESQAWFENQAQNHLIETKDSPKINSGLWTRMMMARFPEEYRDNAKVELTGADGGAIENSLTVTFVNPAPKGE